MFTVWSVWYPWIRNHPSYLRGITSVPQGRILVARMLVTLCNVTYDEAIQLIKEKEWKAKCRDVNCPMGQSS